MKCVSPISIKDPRQSRGSIRIPVDCGKCGACRYNRRADWSFRLAEEAKHSINSFFLTLTYDEQHVPISDYESLTLRKRDLQLFHKRIRKLSTQLWDRKFRYYSVGEYGTTTNRPHYHSIIFNLHNGARAELASKWGHGHVRIDTVNTARIHYITKYHVNYDKHHSKELGREPEFAVMSRNPGIGAQYIDRCKDWNRNQEAYFVMNNGFKQRMPRFFKEKIFSPEEREILSDLAMYEGEKAYWNEVERLEKLGYDNPEIEIERRSYEESLKVEKKATQGLTL